MSTIWEHSWFQHDSDNEVSISEGLNSSMWHWLAGQRRASTWWLVTWWELQLQWAIFTATPWCVNPSTKWMRVLSGCRGGAGAGAGGGPLWSLQSCSPSLRLLTAFATGENDGERTWDQSCELAQLLHNLSNFYVCPKFMYTSLMLVKVHKMIVWKVSFPYLWWCASLVVCLSFCVAYARQGLTRDHTLVVWMQNKKKKDISLLFSQCLTLLFMSKREHTENIIHRMVACIHLF